MGAEQNSRAPVWEVLGWDPDGDPMGSAETVWDPLHFLMGPAGLTKTLGIHWGSSLNYKATGQRINHGRAPQSQADSDGGVTKIGNRLASRFPIVSYA